MNRHAVTLLVLALPIAFTAPAAAEEGPKAMSSQTDCAKSPVQRSICMIERVLEDVASSYAQPGGGGITEVRQVATDTFAVSIAQEERLDVITYELALEKGKVVIKRRTESTKSRGH